MKPDIDERRPTADLIAEIVHLQAQVSELRAANKGLQDQVEDLEVEVAIRESKYRRLLLAVKKFEEWVEGRKNTFARLVGHFNFLDDKQRSVYYDGKWAFAFDAHRVLQNALLDAEKHYIL